LPGGAGLAGFGALEHPFTVQVPAIAGAPALLSLTDGRG
jgi:hypothetical protein